MKVDILPQLEEDIRGRFMGLGLEDNSVRGKAGLGPMSQPSFSVDLSSIHTGRGNGPFLAI